LTPRAPHDCEACKLFFFGEDGEPLRPRLKGEEITPQICAACDLTQESRGTFVWSEESRRLFQKWRVWKCHGGPGPEGFDEVAKFAELDRIAREVAEQCRKPTLH
jgi:hypothetical protein